MTTAILVWQFFVFLSIFLAGRWRGLVIAFWTIWTLFQVVTLPLSAIQFATIIFAYLVSPRRSDLRKESSDYVVEPTSCDDAPTVIHELRPSEDPTIKSNRSDLLVWFVVGAIGFATGGYLADEYGTNFLLLVLIVGSGFTAISSLIKLLDTF